MHSGGAQECAQRSEPAQSELLWATGPSFCTFAKAKAKALFCCHRRRASGAFEGPPALKPVFDGPYACTVRQLGPRERRERKRAGNLFPKWLRRRGQSMPPCVTSHVANRGARVPLANQTKARGGSRGGGTTWRWLGGGVSRRHERREGARMAPSLSCVVCFCGLAAGDARVSCGAGHALCADCCAGYLRQKVRGGARRGGGAEGAEGRGKASPES